MSERTEHLKAVKTAVIKRAGGLLNSSEAARRLGVPVSEIQRRVANGEIIAVPGAEGGPALPAVQFEDEAVREALPRILDAMHVTDPWMRLQLLLDRDVIGAVRLGRPDDAVRAVQSYLAPEDG